MPLSVLHLCFCNSATFDFIEPLIFNFSTQLGQQLENCFYWSRKRNAMLI